jgi:hypothetical protein
MAVCVNGVFCSGSAGIVPAGARPPPPAEASIGQQVDERSVRSDDLRQGGDLGGGKEVHLPAPRSRQADTDAGGPGDESRLHYRREDGRQDLVGLAARERLRPRSASRATHSRTWTGLMRPRGVRPKRGCVSAGGFRSRPLNPACVSSSIAQAYWQVTARLHEEAELFTRWPFVQLIDTQIRRAVE